MRQFKVLAYDPKTDQVQVDFNSDVGNCDPVTMGCITVRLFLALLGKRSYELGITKASDLVGKTYTID